MCQSVVSICQLLTLHKAPYRQWSSGAVRHILTCIPLFCPRRNLCQLGRFCVESQQPLANQTPTVGGQRAPHSHESVSSKDAVLSAADLSRQGGTSGRPNLFACCSSFACQESDHGTRGASPSVEPLEQRANADRCSQANDTRTTTTRATTTTDRLPWCFSSHGRFAIRASALLHHHVGADSFLALHSVGHANWQPLLLRTCQRHGDSGGRRFS
ncbi:hypothetical protein BKA80DRAFT_269662 [Phyllosticta citrichinensis]